MSAAVDEELQEEPVTLPVCPETSADKKKSPSR
jgi:hypothetical protein